MENLTVVWFRRDLRIDDNPALIAAERVGRVIPVYVWSPKEEGQFYPGRVSRWWLKQSLGVLADGLRNLGCPLVMRQSDDTVEVLLEIIRATGATHLFYNHLYDPVSLVRDHKVKKSMAEEGVLVQTYNSDLLYEPWEVYDSEGRAFTTFDGFWDMCPKMSFKPDYPFASPAFIRPAQVAVPSTDPELLDLEDDAEKASNALLGRAWVPGWRSGEQALTTFLQGPLQEYAMNRAKADTPTTSLLSPHMHYGEISVRKIFYSVLRLQIHWRRTKAPMGSQAVDCFLRALGYREYSRYLSFNFPFTHERALLSNLKSFPWRVDEGGFKVWRQGRTGYPLVDAGMRELWATGWLHNRLRVVVSSFCVKFLQLPWRWGMKYFWDTLLDADLESDVLGWQYISGSLPDGHELDRMEDPQLEGYKHDPEGEYVRRWLPELSRLPTEWIHHPWDTPPLILRAAGVELGVNYPLPIVRVDLARERLQDALACMWEQEAALKSAQLNGGEEGLGETREILVGAAQVPMRVHQAMVIRPQGEGSGGEKSVGSSRRDQMVPSMPTVAAAESILRPTTSGVPLDETGARAGAGAGAAAEGGGGGGAPPSPEDSSREGEARVQPVANSEEGLPGTGVQVQVAKPASPNHRPKRPVPPKTAAPTDVTKNQGRLARPLLIGREPRVQSDGDSSAESVAVRNDRQGGGGGGGRVWWSRPVGGGAVPVWSKQSGGATSLASSQVGGGRKEEREGGGSQRGGRNGRGGNRGQPAQEEERSRKRSRRRAGDPSKEVPH